MIYSNLYDNLDEVYNRLFYPDHCLAYKYNPNKPTICDILWNNVKWIGDSVKNGTFARPAIKEEITKTILCGRHELGFSYYECPQCKNFNLVYNRCHSRFCNTCGVKTQKLISEKVSAMAVDASHRHIVFTIPQELRAYFQKDRSALNLLFIAARNTIAELTNNSLYKKNRRRGITDDQLYLYENNRNANVFGMIACLHTFGRDLKWNPHIHCLVPELIYNSSTDSIKSFNHFHFKKLRNTFQYILLDLMSKHFGSSFNIIKNQMYDSKKNGFYVYAKYDNYSSDAGNTNIDHIKGVSAKVNYIMRYASRPAMAQSRITEFDKTNNTVTWFYDRHEDNKRITVHESAQAFIKKLVIHIPDESFQMIRYYGFYHNRCRKTLDRIYTLLSQKNNTKLRITKQRNIIRKINSKKYRCRTFLLRSYERDILLCPCGAQMKYVKSFLPTEEKLDEQYRERCINEMYALQLRGRSSRVGITGTCRS